MTNDDFAHYAAEHLGEYLPTVDGSVEVAAVPAAPPGNGMNVLVKRFGLQVTQQFPVSVCLRLLDAGWPLRSVLEQLAVWVQDEAAWQSVLDVDLADFASVRAHLRTALCDAQLDAAFLEDRPWHPVGSLAMFYQLMFEDAHGRAAYISISDEIMQKWKIPADALRRHAVASAEAADPAWLEVPGDAEPLAETVRPNLLGRPGSRAGQNGLLRLTNRSHYSGAAVAGHPGLLERVRSVTGTDFLVIPHSVHALLILPLGGQIDSAAWRQAFTMARAGSGQILSDRLHLYSESAGQLVAI